MTFVSFMQQIHIDLKLKQEAKCAITYITVISCTIITVIIITVIISIIITVISYITVIS